VRTETEEQILQNLGKLNGKMDSMVTLIETESQNTNKRIDDLDTHMKERLEDMKDAFDNQQLTQDKRLDKLESSLTSLYLKVGSAGGLAGIITALGVEAAKNALK
jgi:hypothetical protein